MSLPHAIMRGADMPSKVLDLFGSTLSASNGEATALVHVPRPKHPRKSPPKCSKSLPMPFPQKVQRCCICIYICIRYI
jgi:hypothetical protein